MIDDDILKIYMRGFNDCFTGIDNQAEYTSILEKRAYQLGWSHSLIGDDVRSVDYLTDDEILQLIKER
jgi:hypothetical protein